MPEVSPEWTAELKKGSIQLCLLALLAKEEKYGFQILRELRERSNGFFDLKEGTLYPTLRRLEEREFVESRWQEPESGMPRKYYRLTDRGRTALAEALAIWDADGRRGTRPGGRPMTPPDAYLEQVRRAMSGMEPGVRDDILRELRSHIAESTAANGGNVNASLAAVGSAEEVGRHYRELYGYGRAYKILFAAIASFLAFLSVPVLAAGAESLFPYALSIVFLVIAAAWILWVSVAAGSRAGILAGFAAMVSRFAAFGIAAITLVGAETTANGLGLLIVVSVMLLPLGWIPGTAKKAWSAPRAQL